MKFDYHTALAKPKEWPALPVYIGKRGLAFQADLCKGIPERMYKAEVWFSEFPWVKGYDKFAARVGKTPDLPYFDLLKKVVAEIERSSIPTVLLVGQHALKVFEPPFHCPAKLNGGDATACLWRVEPWDGVLDSEDILKALAAKYDVVGDFCCGYGRSGRVFSQAGKRYLLSDLDPKCIGHISEHEKFWR